MAAVIAALALLCACVNRPPANADGQTQTIFGQNAVAGTYRDNSIELGVKFTVSQNASATGVRFYKPAGATGVHKGYLYAGNALKASVTFANETASGWQEASFTAPVPLVTGTTYTASYLSPSGVHADTDPFKWPVTSGVLKATTGAYKTGAGGTVPTSDVAENYGADVIVSTGAVTPPPTTTTPAPTTTTTPPVTTTTDVPPTTTTAPPTTTTPPPVGNCPVPTPNAPDGPDGNGGCFPGPATTGPIGTPANDFPPVPPTGRYVFTGGERIDGKIIPGGILVTGNDVKITNSIINGTIEVYKTGSLLVEDSEIHGGDAYWATMMGYNFDLTRTEIDGGQQAAICSGGCDWADVYSHDPHWFPNQDAHQSAFATTGIENGVGLSVRHSTLWCNVAPAPSGGGCTGDLALQSDFGDVTNVVIDHNLFPPSQTGSYCITGGNWPQKPFQNPTGVKITNNVFVKGSTGKCGFYGPVDAVSTDASKGNVFTGNVFDDGTPVHP